MTSRQPTIFFETMDGILYCMVENCEKLVRTLEYFKGLFRILKVCGGLLRIVVE